MQDSSILLENKEYWSHRATSYSDVSQWELNGESLCKWRNTIIQEIEKQFGSNHSQIHILEVGTGPGFFAILLAQAGFSVTAIDLTPNMLLEAQKNAGSLVDQIHFQEMNAEALDFADHTFDVVISRNLTWNLPHPEKAYREWYRVLKKDGLLLNFDANWYHYLFDTEQKEAYELDRINTANAGYDDQNVGENFDVMEDIAKRIPLSSTARPAWDVTVLSSLGMRVETDEQIWEKVWTKQEQLNFASTPMFMIKTYK